MTAEWITSKEFVLTPPKKLGKHSVVIICSHGGNTKETVGGCRLAIHGGAVPRGERTHSIHHSNAYARRTDSLHPRPDACHSDKQCKAGLAESGLRRNANFGAGV